MAKLVPFLLAFVGLSLAPSFAHADMCVALQKGERGYEDKILTLKRVASVSYSTSEQAKLKEQIDQIRDMCSYKIFIELLKKERNWEPYVYSSALAAKTTDAQDAFIELVTKHPGKWQPATYRCASQIDSKEKANLFKQMIEQAVRVDFPAVAYDVLADINYRAQLEAFSLILQKKVSFNWQDAVFKAVLSLKPRQHLPNYRLLAFKALINRVQLKDWPAEAYSRLATLNSDYQYVNFIQKYKLELEVKTPPEFLLDIYNPFDNYFDNQDLESLIKDNNIGSIEALLPKLPEWLRMNYTLMFYSRSPQEASFQKPRAIMYMPFGDFIAAFNDHSMKGGDVFETISVNKKTFEFEFREIVFKNGKAQFSPINPSKCAACHHGSDRKPNWEEYPFWMGAYGMNDDMINGKALLKTASRAGDIATPQDIRDAETMLKKIGGMPALENTFEEFKKFRAAKAKHPRYQYLIDPASTKLKYPPYREEGEEAVGGQREGLVRATPNENLNEILGAWNVQRIFRKIKNAPGYEKEKMNLLHFLAGCEANLEQLRDNLGKEFLSTGVLPGSRYDELFTKTLGVDYLKMTDLTFNRDVMLLNDLGFEGSDYRMAYLLAEDLKKSIPGIGKYIKVTKSSEFGERAVMSSIAQKLLLVNHKWEGCDALEKAMKKGQ